MRPRFLSGNAIEFQLVASSAFVVAGERASLCLRFHKAIADAALAAAGRLSGLIQVITGAMLALQNYVLLATFCASSTRALAVTQKRASLRLRYHIMAIDARGGGHPGAEVGDDGRVVGRYVETKLHASLGCCQLLIGRMYDGAARRHAGRADTGRALVRGGCGKLIFIGSTDVGRAVMRDAADTLTPVTLELGGKDPFVVCDDVSVAEVLPTALRAAFQSCGQNCVAAERFIVQAGVYDEFVARCGAAAAAMRQGNPLGARSLRISAARSPLMRCHFAKQMRALCAVSPMTRVCQRARSLVEACACMLLWRHLCHWPLVLPLRHEVGALIHL